MTLPTDTYYRGYRLSHQRQGTPTEQVNIYYGSDFLGACPTMDQAKGICDGYMEAP